MAKYPVDLLTLITFFKKFPGVGTRTAERFAFQLLEWPQKEIEQFADHLSKLKQTITECPRCYCLTEKGNCLFCDNPHRNPQQLCVISSPKDAFALESTGSYRGLYHVLGGLLSPLDGIAPQHLRLDTFQERAAALNVSEIIIALDSTLEGDATALYLKEQLQHLPVSIFRLAFGLPLGSSLDFVDGGTLSRAFVSRQVF